MNLVWESVLVWLTVSGFVGFVLMGVDKARTRDGSWRIPEKVLLRLAIVGGAFGIVLGSSAFHHKTLKDSFIDGILVMVLIWIVLLVGLLRLWGPPFP